MYYVVGLTIVSVLGYRFLSMSRQTRTPLGKNEVMKIILAKGQPSATKS